MRTGIIRIAIIIISVILQISFFNFLFFGNLAVDLIPLIVLAWVIILGFEKSWPWIIFLGIFNDLAGNQKVGISVIFFILLAYLVSFFSRRFLIEKRFSGFIAFAFFLILALFFLDAGRFLLIEGFSLSETYAHVKLAVFSWEKLLLQGIIEIGLFYLVYIVINKIEENISIESKKLRLD